MFSRRKTLQAGVGGLTSLVFGRAGGGGGFSEAAGQVSTTVSPPSYNKAVESPSFQRADAMKKLFSDALFKREFLASLYEQFYEVTQIDPDLQILKSISPMAKIALQRQRNVQRAYDRAWANDFHNHIGNSFLENKIHSLMWGSGCR